MKTLIVAFALLLCSIVAQAQDIEIPLKDTTITIHVCVLKIRPIGAPRMTYFPPDSVNQVMGQDVYYQLVDKQGIVREAGNKTIPLLMYSNGFKYIDGTVTPSVINTINYFLQAADWKELQAIMPKPTTTE